MTRTLTRAALAVLLALPVPTQRLAGLGVASRSEGRAPAVLPGPSEPVLRRGLIADYYNLDRSTLQLPTGEATVRRIDGGIWFSWGRGAPMPRIAPDFFGVRWQGYLKAETPGRYVFTVRHGGAARFALGGQLIYENLRSARRPVTIEYVVSKPGWIPLVFETLQGFGTADVHLAWSPPNTSTVEAIPAFVLAHREG
ncbi:MAG: hypothetical protein IPK85_05265 [Gemmatimonadetes bacterium]|nr:hypothetical protein [Gemmatimonadota bacterium]